MGWKRLIPVAGGLVLVAAVVGGNVLSPGGSADATRSPTCTTVPPAVEPAAAALCALHVESYTGTPTHHRAHGEAHSQHGGPVARQAHVVGESQDRYGDHAVTDGFSDHADGHCIHDELILLAHFIDAHTGHLEEVDDNEITHTAGMDGVTGHDDVQTANAALIHLAHFIHRHVAEDDASDDGHGFAEEQIDGHDAVHSIHATILHLAHFIHMHNGSEGVNSDDPNIPAWDEQTENDDLHDLHAALIHIAHFVHDHAAVDGAAHTDLDAHMAEVEDHLADADMDAICAAWFKIAHFVATHTEHVDVDSPNDGGDDDDDHSHDMHDDIHALHAALIHLAHFIAEHTEAYHDLHPAGLLEHEADHDAGAAHSHHRLPVEPRREANNGVERMEKGPMRPNGNERSTATIPNSDSARRDRGAERGSARRNSEP